MVLRTKTSRRSCFEKDNFDPDSVSASLSYCENPKFPTTLETVHACVLAASKDNDMIFISGFRSRFNVERKSLSPKLLDLELCQKVSELSKSDPFGSVQGVLNSFE
jgi:hypothetical protein